MSLVKLQAGVQNYDWGLTGPKSFVAKMVGKADDTSDKKYAELWVGTHPSCPTRLANDGKHELLSDFLARDGNAEKFLSPAHQASPFANTVPYLLKILSIRTALSIQAHPCKALAEKLHAAKPDKYKDPNHKPELICALTPYEALCCFRSLSDIVKHLRRIPELAQLISAAEVLGDLFQPGATFPPADSDVEKKALRGLMEKLYAADESTCKNALRAHLARLQSNGTACKEDEVFVRVYGQYPDDVGCWMVYVLNYVQMSPGQALFLSDSEPHAYISGEGVEIMACSDNVVRAGLTPKWKDVPTLVSMLKYDTTGLASAHHDRKGDEEPGSKWQVQWYYPPAQFPDFSLVRLEYDHNSGNGATSVELPTIGLGFCLKGSAKINGVNVKECDVFAVPYGKVSVEADGKESLVFIASSNKDLSVKSKI